MIKRIVAIYPGRFQPFGKHHAEAFNWLAKTFGKQNTYIATSGVVQPPKSPFTFAEKQTVISNYGLGDRVIMVKNPYKAEEILSKFDPATTAVVFMVGKKDMMEDPRFAMKPKKDGSPSYFQAYDKNKGNMEGFDKHGYLIIAPHISINIPGYGEMSGTAIRKALGDKKVSRINKKKLFQGVFGWYNDKDANMIFNKLESLNESKRIFSKEWWAPIINEILSEMSLTSAGVDEFIEYVRKDKNAFNYIMKEFGRIKSIEDLEEYIRECDYSEWIDLQSVLAAYKEDNNIQESKKRLTEGGAGGHMHHPFDIEWVQTGKDLLKVFSMSEAYLKTNRPSVKIDGVNASIRLVTLDGKKQFVMDRGSNKPLDVKGITKAELKDRFGEGHGMIVVGGKVLDIFNNAIPKIKTELTQLGLWNNPNILFNIEYVEGKTNVQEYGKNFLAIHGLLEIAQTTPTKRSTREVSHNESTLQALIDKLNPVAQKSGFEVVGSVPAEMARKPKLGNVLSHTYTINYPTGKVTKSLKDWLAKTVIPKEGTITLTNGKKVAPLSKQVFLELYNEHPLDEFVQNEADYVAAVNGYITYLATMKLGEELLDALNSALGPVSGQEGIVIRDKSITEEPFKITGSFIIRGLDSGFKQN
jgi:hypothetical protein